MAKKKTKKKPKSSQSNGAQEQKSTNKQATDARPVGGNLSSQSQSTLNGSRWVWIGGVLALLMLIGGGAAWFMNAPQSEASSEEMASGARSGFEKPTVEASGQDDDGSANNPDGEYSTVGLFPDGAANHCFGGPRFQKQLGFQAGQSYIGTSPGQYIGLFLADATGSGRVHQEPTWDDGGNLGSFVYDGQGHIYLIPAVFMNLHHDRLEDQTKLYRVDSDSAEMKMIIDLPAVRPPHNANPHGLSGLFYDCDTDSLYVSSVAGSTPQVEYGRIFQVDLKTNEVASSIEDLDALGVGVFNGMSGKRLYYGSGRDTGIYSIPLDKDGALRGTPRLEFYLAALPNGRNDKATRITFNDEEEMVVKGLDFHYTLTVERPTLYRNYRLSYDQENDGWKFVDVESKSK